MLESQQSHRIFGCCTTEAKVWVSDAFGFVLPFLGKLPTRRVVNVWFGGWFSCTDSKHTLQRSKSSIQKNIKYYCFLLSHFYSPGQALQVCRIPTISVSQQSHMNVISVFISSFISLKVCSGWVIRHLQALHKSKSSHVSHLHLCL